MKINRNKLKNQAAKNILTALTVAPALAVMLISAVYNISARGIEGQITTAEPVTLAVMTLVILTASTTLALLYDIKPALMIFAAIMLVCFICYLTFTVRGETDIYSESFFESTMLAFSVPVWSYMPIAICISESVPAVVSAVMTFLIFAANAGALIYLCVRDGGNKNNG